MNRKNVNFDSLNPGDNVYIAIPQYFFHPSGMRYVFSGKNSLNEFIFSNLEVPGEICKLKEHHEIYVFTKKRDALLIMIKLLTSKINEIAVLLSERNLK